MRPRILLLNIPRLLRDLLLAILRERADVTEVTMPATDVGATGRGIPLTSFDLVIVCDDPRREDDVMQEILAVQTRPRYLALRGPGEQATEYTLEPRVELIDAATTERLLSEVAALGNGSRRGNESA